MSSIFNVCKVISRWKKKQCKVWHVAMNDVQITSQIINVSVKNNWGPVGGVRDMDTRGAKLKRDRGASATSRPIHRVSRFLAPKNPANSVAR